MEKLLIEEKLYVLGLIREIREVRLRFTLKFDETDQEFRNEDVKTLATLYKELNSAIDHFPELTLDDIKLQYLKLMAENKERKDAKTRKLKGIYHEKIKKPNFIHSMYRCVKTPERKLCPSYLLVSSSGPGLLTHPDCMGPYKLSHLKVNNYPIYEMCDPRINQSYIFLNSSGRWVVGREGKPGLGVVKEEQTGRPGPPIFGWRYSQNKMWKEDITITVKPIDDEWRSAQNKHCNETITLESCDDENKVENGREDGNEVSDIGDSSVRSPSTSSVTAINEIPSTTSCELKTNSNSNKIPIKPKRFSSKIPVAKNSSMKYKLFKENIFLKKSQAMKTAQNVLDDDCNNNNSFALDTNVDEDELERDLKKLEENSKTQNPSKLPQLVQQQYGPGKIYPENQVKNVSVILSNDNIKASNYHPFIPYASKKLGEVLYEKTRLHLQNIKAFDEQVVAKNESLKKLWYDWELKISYKEKDQEKERHLILLRQKSEIQELQIKHTDEINELSSKWNVQNVRMEEKRISELQNAQNDIQSSKKGLSKEKGKFQRHRHDSILKFIAFHIDRQKYEAYTDIPGYEIQDQGFVLSKTIPRRFLKTKDNPDIVIIDVLRKMLNIFELTVSLEQNIKDQHLKKVMKYEHLSKDIVNFGSGFSAEIIAFEIGARGLITEANKRRIEKLHKFLKDINFGELCKNIKMLAAGGTTA